MDTDERSGHAAARDHAVSGPQRARDDAREADVSCRLISRQTHMQDSQRKLMPATSKFPGLEVNQLIVLIHVPQNCG
eukprot:934717-Pyramimonas_sp.AAC.1